MQSAGPEAVDLVEGIGSDEEAVRHGRSGDCARSDATACWRAGWWSAASASSSCTADRAAAGTRTRTSKAITRKWCRVSDKPIAGLLTDLKARGHARRHARGLGRRVRPHAVQRERATAAITIRGASRSGWRAAASKAARPSAPPTRSVCARSRTTVARPRHPRHDSARARPRSSCGSRIMHNGRAERPTIVSGNVIKEFFA